MSHTLLSRLENVVRLVRDTHREFRDRYSTLYPHGVVRKVCRRFPDYSHIEVFVETGTFRGKTARQESRYFREVHTIELSEALYNSNLLVFSEKYPNVHSYLGDSVEWLPVVLGQLSEPCVVFLDAHWSGDESVDWKNSKWKGYDVPTAYRGEKWPPDPDQQCPLVEEVKAISDFPYPCMVIIDDWNVAGKKDLQFQGEDWSGITLDRVLSSFDSSRLVSYLFVGYRGKKRLVVLLK